MGKAFMSWADQLEDVPEWYSGLNERYEQCLIIDETVLQVLEGLSAVAPPLGAPEIGPKLPSTRSDNEENYGQD